METCSQNSLRMSCTNFLDNLIICMVLSYGLMKEFHDITVTLAIDDVRAETISISYHYVWLLTKKRLSKM